jgi:hypothetical protein
VFVDLALRRYGHHQWVNYFLHAGHLNIKGINATIHYYYFRSAIATRPHLIISYYFILSRIINLPPPTHPLVSYLVLFEYMNMGFGLALYEPFAFTVSSYIVVHPKPFLLWTTLVLSPLCYDRAENEQVPEELYHDSTGRTTVRPLCEHNTY